MRSLFDNRNFSSNARFPVADEMLLGTRCIIKYTTVSQYNAECTCPDTSAHTSAHSLCLLAYISVFI